MTLLVAGLLLFFAVHSVRIVGDNWRSAAIKRIGAGPWKGLYSLVSIAGFVLLVWGYSQARQQMPLWDPPAFMKHITGLLMLPVFPMFIASYVPQNGLRARLHHPQVLSIKLWAFAHLLSNGNLADVVLFGSFLLWAVLSYRAARQRDEDVGTLYVPGTTKGTAITWVAGLVAYAVFVMGLHAWLIGVRPY
jgi:uncharacterized membrane protein